MRILLRPYLSLLLLKKVDKDITFETMKSIIEDVNIVGVIPEEILSDELYVYDCSEKKLSIAKVQEPRQEQCVKQGLDTWPEEEPKSEREQKLAEGLTSFQKFKETVLSEIKNYLPKDFEGQISIEAGKEYIIPHDELIIQQNGTNIKSQIDLTYHYDSRMIGMGMEDILKSIASEYCDEIKHVQENAQHVGNVECAGTADEMEESPENEGQNLGMEQSM